MCQVNDHSREETRFRKSQAEACCVELPGGVHKASQDRDYAPGDHDPRNPFSRAPPFHDDGSGYLKQNIGQVKHAYAEAVPSGR